MNRRTLLMTVAVLVLLVVAVSWAYGLMAKERDAASMAMNNLTHCRQLVDAMAQLDRQPELALQREQEHAQTTQAVENAAKEADISSSSLLRISPEPPQRLGETVYKEKPTRVLLRGVTLPQIATLIYGLTTGGESLHSKSLRVTAPRRDDNGKTWDAEIVLTYLFYEPPNHRD